MLRPVPRGEESVEAVEEFSGGSEDVAPDAIAGSGQEQEAGQAADRRAAEHRERSRQVEVGGVVRGERGGRISLGADPDGC